MCRSATERLIRRFLEAAKDTLRNESSAESTADPQAAILYLDVHRGLKNAPDGNTISLSNRSLWRVSTHHLNAQTYESDESIDAPAKMLPLATDTLRGDPYIFGSIGNHEADVCPDGKYVSPPPSSADWLKPSRSDTKGWQLVDYNGKVGWECTLVEESNKGRRYLQYLTDAINRTWLTHRNLKAKGRSSSRKRPKRISAGKQSTPSRPELPPAIVARNTSDLQEIQDSRQAYVYAVKERKLTSFNLLRLFVAPLQELKHFLKMESLQVERS